MDPCPQQGTLWRPRVHAELRAAGTRCSRRRVARLMHEAGIQGKVRKRYKSTTQADAAHVPVEDLVRRNFDVSRPITVWAVDMSYLPTKEGWLYLAVVLDSHARLVVGWSMGERLTTELPLSALRMAFDRWRPPPGLIHHSDRGSQYTSHAYRSEVVPVLRTSS
ncbi:IS3 family transposase [Deinococcus malanensis]